MSRFYFVFLLRRVLFLSPRRLTSCHVGHSPRLVSRHYTTDGFYYIRIGVNIDYWLLITHYHPYYYTSLYNILRAVDTVLHYIPSHAVYVTFMIKKSLKNFQGRICQKKKKLKNKNKKK